MNRMISLFFSFFALFFSCNSEHDKLPDGLYAEMETSKGKILLQLEYEKTPVTVANFVSLAEGKNTLVSQKFAGKPFYDGLKFHRVIANFMIQGGDPDGNGSGGPGYKFKDEFRDDLKMDKEGVLAMANSGPATNGSQFFITHKETNYLNGRHTVFGHVVTGQDVVNKIAQDDQIIKVTIIRRGAKAKKFDAAKVFKAHFEVEAAAKKAQDAKTAKVKIDKVAYFATVKNAGTKTESGLVYNIVQKGSGQKPAAGTTVYVHYAGYFENGDLFDSSYENVNKDYGKFDPNRAAQNGYQPFPFQAGRKDGLIPGFLEGLEKMSLGDKAVLFIPSNLGYGAQGAGGIIPPNANLVFELELLEAMPAPKTPANPAPKK
ncbi:peptidylprolyl isomerase [Flavobacterium humi]|uniref:peptidylprolyl isomerase n=1 Tax=Flavobacterium humi TaxID=2562683 RepID=A0A4Z0L9F3_9FLAO|nr:peptidylprolyl isomerase [Flavobacterium humi]TGD59095.1 peptidylprolyl isomerase [Flavobacterium humi]